MGDWLFNFADWLEYYVVDFFARLVKPIQLRIECMRDGHAIYDDLLDEEANRCLRCDSDINRKVTLDRDRKIREATEAWEETKRLVRADARIS